MLLECQYGVVFSNELRWFEPINGITSEMQEIQRTHIDTNKQRVIKKSRKNTKD